MNIKLQREKIFLFNGFPRSGGTENSARFSISFVEEKTGMNIKIKKKWKVSVILKPVG